MYVFINFVATMGLATAGTPLVVVCGVLMVASLLFEARALGHAGFSSWRRLSWSMACVVGSSGSELNQLIPYTFLLVLNH